MFIFIFLDSDLVLVLSEFTLIVFRSLFIRNQRLFSQEHKFVFDEFSNKFELFGGYYRSFDVDEIVNVIVVKLENVNGHNK